MSLYPNVKNEVGVPATEKLVKDHPNPRFPSKCLLEALDIALHGNACQYTDGDGRTLFAKPNHGTAMCPCHAVDIFMGELDRELVSCCPVPLLSSRAPPLCKEEFMYLDWSRFRDNGITILPNAEYVFVFEQHLQNLHLPDIKWVVTHVKEAEYLDVKLHIVNDLIETDVFSKNCHSYLPPYSCHAPSVFKGLISGVGTRWCMLCTDDQTLEERLNEYSKYFYMSGWKRQKAQKELKRGAAKNRKK